MLVYLRDLRRSDLKDINRWRNDVEVVRFLGANFLFVGPEVDDQWFDRYLATRENAVRLAVVDLEQDRILGAAYLTDIHRINRSAEFGIMIGEKDAWCRGIGTDITRQVLAHGFDDLNLHRIYLSVLADNARAVRVYEKVGFRTEGRQNEAVFKEGRFRDVLMMAILRTQFRAVLPSGGGEV